MNILIAGFGFVGQAHHAVLSKTFSVSVYDPEKGHTDFGSPDAVIICVSTPPRHDGSCEMANVYEVVERCPDSAPILIKSTISVEGWQMLKETFPEKKLAFSPEFLRSATALEDFYNNRHMFIGGDETGYWHALFRVAFDDDTFTTELAVPEELILAKYLRNSFLALKVSFFNQAYDLCKSVGVNYDVVSYLVGEDERIGHSHTQITQERGFGGHCFPKDTAALVRTAQRAGVSLSILQEAREYNKRIRRE